MGDFTPEVPPEHLNRIKPRTIGRQIQEHQVPGSGAHDGFHFLVLMCRDIIPRHIDGVGGMFIEQVL